MKKKYVKALGWLLGILLLFTVVSRVTASFTVPQVVTEQPSPRTVTHVVTVQGTVEGVLETAVLTEPGLLVEHVYAEAGQQVEAGEVLAVLNEEDLAERIRQMKEEIQILKLSNTALTKEESTRAITRAAEDYDYAVRTAQAQVDRAAEQVAYAMGAYERAQWSDVPPTVEQNAALLQAIQSAQAAYDAALLQQEQSVRAAARAVEDAENAVNSDNQAKINQIRIAQIERELAPLLALKDAEGRITAQVSGVITGVALATGQRTADTAAFTMVDATAGMRCVARLSGADADGIAAGDEAARTKNGVRQGSYTVTSVEPQPDGSVRLSISLEGTDSAFVMGETMALEIEKTSTYSRTAIPVTALHEQNGKYFVYVLETVGTVLGEEYRAVRMDVTIIDRNNLYVALQEGVLSGEMQVIVDSDRYVEAGDIVRLQAE